MPDKFKFKSKEEKREAPVSHVLGVNVGETWLEQDGAEQTPTHHKCWESLFILPGLKEKTLIFKSPTIKMSTPKNPSISQDLISKNDLVC